MLIELALLDCCGLKIWFTFVWYILEREELEKLINWALRAWACCERWSSRRWEGPPVIMLAARAGGEAYCEFNYSGSCCCNSFLLTLSAKLLLTLRFASGLPSPNGFRINW
jgi:hypothetical protein